MKTIWIDCDNSPHVPLFLPVCNELEERGHQAVLTARHFAQTIELLNQSGRSYTAIGHHYGKNKIKKLWGLLVRTFQLIRFIRKYPVDVAVNHGSRSQILAARLLGIPVFSGFDYEHTELKLLFLFSTKIWVPEKLSDKILQEIGAPLHKIVKYPGYKEELYLYQKPVDSDFRSKLGVPEGRLLVVVRPAAQEANYHHAGSEKILDCLVKKLKSREEIYTILIPRSERQYQNMKEYDDEYFKVKQTVYDGLNLVSAADILISGGGTMNREAVLCGTKVYSIFSGKQGALDEDMEIRGLLTFVRKAGDVEKIHWQKNQKPLINSSQERINLAGFLVDEMMTVLTDS